MTRYGQTAKNPGCDPGATLRAQCGAPGDDHGAVTEHSIGDDQVWLHRECLSYLENHQNSDRAGAREHQGLHG